MKRKKPSRNTHSFSFSRYVNQIVILYGIKHYSLTLDSFSFTSAIKVAAILSVYFAFWPKVLCIAHFLFSCRFHCEMLLILCHFDCGALPGRCLSSSLKSSGKKSPEQCFSIFESAIRLNVVVVNMVIRNTCWANRNLVILLKVSAFVSFPVRRLFDSIQCLSPGTFCALRKKWLLLSSKLLFSFYASIASKHI